MQLELQMHLKFRAANGDDSWLHTLSRRVPLSEHPLPGRVRLTRKKKEERGRKEARLKVTVEEWFLGNGGVADDQRPKRRGSTSEARGCTCTGGTGCWSSTPPTEVANAIARAKTRKGHTTAEGMQRVWTDFFTYVVKMRSSLCGVRKPRARAANYSAWRRNRTS